MKEEHKKRLCELAGEYYESKCSYYNKNDIYCSEECDDPFFRCDGTEITLEILIKAMWAINRRAVKESGFCICSSTGGDFYVYYGKYQRAAYPRKDHNNSELEALTAALTYIYQQEDENEAN
jgi:hypothetical protein